MATAKKIAQAFAWLRANWPTYEWTADTARVYERCLSDIPDDVLEAAVIQCIRTRAFFPKVSELLDAAHEIMSPDRPSAYEAWEQVKRKLSLPPTLYRDGKRLKPAPLHPLIERAVAGIGGWHELRLSENGIADRARFIQCYEALLERERGRLGMLPETRRVAERYAGGELAARSEALPGGSAGEPAPVGRIIAEIARERIGGKG